MGFYLYDVTYTLNGRFYKFALHTKDEDLLDTLADMYRDIIHFPADYMIISRDTPDLLNQVRAYRDDLHLRLELYDNMADVVLEPHNYVQEQRQGKG